MSQIAKPLLSIILEFDTISTQYLQLRAFFYQFFVHFVFSRSNWNIKIQRGNECVILSKWEWCDLLLLDTKENANLWRADVAFSAVINYFRKLFDFFRDYSQTCISWNNQRKMFVEKSCSKNLIRKREKSGKLIMRKMSKSLSEVDYSIF